MWVLSPLNSPTFHFLRADPTIVNSHDKHELETLPLHVQYNAWQVGTISPVCRNPIRKETEDEETGRGAGGVQLS
jgi:hypothetical protein